MTQPCPTPLRQPMLPLDPPRLSGVQNAALWTNCFAACSSCSLVTLFALYVELQAALQVLQVRCRQHVRSACWGFR